MGWKRKEKKMKKKRRRRSRAYWGMGVYLHQFVSSVLVRGEF